MCGIAGIVSADSAGSRSRVERMVASLKHRGPDGLGVGGGAGATLGHTRLAIVDLASGAQPMSDATGRRHIVFNGEIYGYRELRSRLEYPYRTTSDTELILALYARHGAELLGHLPGMFAFALWDEDQRTLLVARDRFGEKPLYHSVGPGGEFVFASEIKALLASGLVRPRLRRTALAHYLNRLYVPVGSSIYAGVEQLLPGHAGLWRDGTLRTWRYWEPPTSGPSVGLGEAAEEFRRLFDQAVGRQLVADVEVGAFLSGGLDSSTVVSVAAERKPELRTFSFAFSEGPNEVEYARAVAALCRTRHLELGDTQSGIPDVLVALAGVYDEPFADSSAVPTYLISRLAARHLKVVLTGDGSDELLGGYPWYRDVWLQEGFATRGRFHNRWVYEVLRVARRVVPGGRERYRRRLEAFHRWNAGESVAESHRRLTEFVTRTELRAVGLPEIAPLQGLGDGGTEAALRRDLGDYMAGDILVKTDRASMASGLELRAPFLDLDLASFCLSLPTRFKLDGHADKVLLREAYASRWPPSVRQRPKQGFAAPVAQWLRRSEFRDLQQAYLEASGPRAALAGLLGEPLVAQLASEGNDRTWALLVLSVWLQTHSVES